MKQETINSIKLLIDLLWGSLDNPNIQEEIIKIAATFLELIVNEEKK